MVSVSKIFEFAAAHRLYRSDRSEEWNRQVYGKCANVNGHGHNYTLEVTVAGEVDAETGMIVNATVIDGIVKESILDQMDHRNLNLDVEWLSGRVTTVEVLIEAIWERLAPAITEAARPAFLKRLVLWETKRIYAVKEI